VEGLVDLGTAVKVHSPCPRLYIAAAVAINTTACGVIRTSVFSHRSQTRKQLGYLPFEWKVLLLFIYTLLSSASSWPDTRKFLISTTVAHRTHEKTSRPQSGIKVRPIVLPHLHVLDCATAAAADLDWAMPNASPCYFSAGDVKVETYYHGHQSVLIARDRRYMCNKAFYTDLSPWPMTLTVNPSELWSWSIHTQLIKDKFASCNNLLNTFIYRVGEKSKLLILSEYVNKTEKIGGTWTNTNSYIENEALSDIFT